MRPGAGAGAGTGACMGRKGADELLSKGADVQMCSRRASEQMSR